MSLRHAILAVLTAEPMTGYDLVQHFDESVGFLWTAPQSQIYPTLHTMDAEGLLRSEVQPRGARAKKRVYDVTAAGRAELARWTSERNSYPADRDGIRLKAAFYELADLDAAEQQLREHADRYRRRLEQWQERIDAIRARRVPLLRKRLHHLSPDRHDATVAFKVFAFEGQIARARSEIEWAERGLELIRRLRS